MPDFISSAFTFPRKHFLQDGGTFIRLMEDRTINKMYNIDGVCVAAGSSDTASRPVINFTASDFFHNDYRFCGKLTVCLELQFQLHFH